MLDNKFNRHRGPRPLYETRMTQKLIHFPQHMLDAIDKNGGSPWVRALIDKELAAQARKAARLRNKHE